MRLAAHPRILFSLVACASMTLAFTACDRSSKPAASPEEPRPQTAGTVRLSKEVQARLGIAITSASRREVQNTLATTGWLEAPPGSEATVKAPLAGFVTEIAGRGAPGRGEFGGKKEGGGGLLVVFSPAGKPPVGLRIGGSGIATPPLKR